jgi:hypothetical protein
MFDEPPFTFVKQRPRNVGKRLRCGHVVETIRQRAVRAEFFWQLAQTPIASNR